MNEVIASDEDAYEWLKKYMEDGVVDRIELVGWPHMRIRLTGAKFHNSLTPSVMKGFVDFQTSINRAFALARYGVPDVRKLSNEEREALELVVEVEEGSSILDVDFQALLEKLIGPVGAKMEPDQLILLLIALGVLWAGKESYKAYLANRRRVREAELASEDRRAALAQVENLSAQETERMRLISSLVRKDPQFRNMARLSYDGKTDLLKALANADTVEIDGVEVEGSVIKELVTNARRKSGLVRLDGDYLIQRVDTSSHQAVKVRARQVTSDFVIDAAVEERMLSAEARKLLQAAEWDRHPIKLGIAAKVMFDEVKSAQILSVGEIPTAHEDAADDADDL